METQIKMNDAGVRELKDKALLFLETIAENIRIEAQNIAPVKTGKLKDSIKVFDGDNKNEKLIGTKTTTYALFVELGTIKMDPQPYLRPSLDKIVGEL